jgi:hypothetical protein
MIELCMISFDNWLVKIMDIRLDLVAMLYSNAYSLDILIEIN